MKSRGSLKFGQIGAPIAELGALEYKKNPHILIVEEMVLPLFLSCFWSDLFHIYIHTSKSLAEFEIQPDLTRDKRVSCP